MAKPLLFDVEAVRERLADAASCDDDTDSVTELRAESVASVVVRVGVGRDCEPDIVGLAVAVATGGGVRDSDAVDVSFDTDNGPETDSEAVQKVAETTDVAVVVAESAEGVGAGVTDDFADSDTDRTSVAVCRDAVTSGLRVAEDVIGYVREAVRERDGVGLLLLCESSSVMLEDGVLLLRVLDIPLDSDADGVGCGVTVISVAVNVGLPCVVLHEPEMKPDALLV